MHVECGEFGLPCEAYCPDGNTDPNGLVWTRPPCGLDSCDEPGQVPAGYQRDSVAAISCDHVQQFLCSEDPQNCLLALTPQWEHKVRFWDNGLGMCTELYWLCRKGQELECAMMSRSFQRFPCTILGQESKKLALEFVL